MSMRVWPWLAGLALAACTAPWSAVVRYSDEPAPAGESPVVGVYAAALGSVLDSTDDSVIVDTAPPHNWIGGSDWFAPNIPSYWVDSLKRNLREAVTGPAIARAPDRMVVAAAAAERHVELLWAPHPTSGPGDRVLPTIALSDVGFNHDSTIAAIRISFHRGRFSFGETLYLARHPGQKWCTFEAPLEWIT